VTGNSGAWGPENGRQMLARTRPQTLLPIAPHRDAGASSRDSAFALDVGKILLKFPQGLDALQISTALRGGHPGGPRRVIAGLRRMVMDGVLDEKKGRFTLLEPKPAPPAKPHGAIGTGGPLPDPFPEFVADVKHAVERLEEGATAPEIAAMVAKRWPGTGYAVNTALELLRGRFQIAKYSDTFQLPVKDTGPKLDFSYVYRPFYGDFEQVAKPIDIPAPKQG
jgi:hypothetical protein